MHLCILRRKYLILTRLIIYLLVSQLLNEVFLLYFIYGFQKVCALAEFSLIISDLIMKLFNTTSFIKPPGIKLLEFNQKQNCDRIDELRQEYIKSSDLPKWKRKIFMRKFAVFTLVPVYFTVFCYRKLERLVDYLEYGV